MSRRFWNGLQERLDAWIQELLLNCVGYRRRSGSAPRRRIWWPTPTTAPGPRRGRMSSSTRRTTAHVVAVLRIADAARVPVVPRGSATGLAGGAVPVEGSICLNLARMNRILEISVPDTRRGRPAGRDHPGSAARGREARLLLPARPGQRLPVHGRRQRGDQRGRPALPEVRRHRRLRPGAGGRAGGRARAAPGRPDDQGRGRVRPQAALHRVGGHAGRRHRDHGAADPQARGAVDRAGRVPPAGGCLRRRSGISCRPASSRS